MLNTEYLEEIVLYSVSQNKQCVMNNPAVVVKSLHHLFRTTVDKLYMWHEMFLSQIMYFGW